MLKSHLQKVIADAILRFNASEVEPGQTICVEAGGRTKLSFAYVEGTAENPIIIKNCGGDVVVGGGPESAGITIY